MTTETIAAHTKTGSRRSTARFGPALALNVGAALSSLRSNLFRAALTILGVVIGVAAVIVLVAFGEGAQREITSQIDTLGATVAVVVPGKMQGQANFNPMGGLGLSNITHDDVQAIRAVPGVRAAAPVTFIGGGVYHGKKAAEICMPIATTPEFPDIRRLEIASGRFFTDDELDQPVCVLGKGIRDDLFGTKEPVGQKITLNNKAYTVIGVAAERSIGSGMFGGDELDAIIYLPAASVEQQYGMSLIHRVLVDVAPDQEPEAVFERVRETMLRAHNGRDDFSLLGAKELMGMFYRIFTLLAALLLGITSISLIVGGIGIMNVMLVSVTERTREIGIRKTVGARRRDIFFQFLTEAVVLSILGGALGISLAVVACRVVTYWLPIQPIITLSSVLLGFGVCVVVGVVSGVIPAVAAARKDPIEAIRYE